MSRLPSPPSNNGCFPCSLPVGLMRRGRVERQAVLQPVQGETRLRLFALDFSLSRERALSLVLACCLRELAGLPNPSPEEVHRLTLCDRHALVLTLVRAELSEISIAAPCPGCARLAELCLDLGRIRPSRHHPARGLTVNRRSGGRVEKKQMRLPQPADVEAAADAVGVVAACMNCSREEARSWRGAAERRLAEADPLGALEIVGQCPECGHRVSASYDLVGTWLKQVRRRTEDLLQAIHVLASCYHWSENEIIRLPALRRQAYLDLCAEQGTQAALG